VLIFSHDQFIRAVRMIILHPGATDRQRMKHFCADDGLPAVQNAEVGSSSGRPTSGDTECRTASAAWREALGDGRGVNVPGVPSLVSKTVRRGGSRPVPSPGAKSKGSGSECVLVWNPEVEQAGGGLLLWKATPQITPQSQFLKLPHHFQPRHVCPVSELQPNRSGAVFCRRRR
jgi:hypothetical protein